MRDSRDVFTGKPKFSIITAVFNGADVLRHTIESVREQTFHSVEHVIVDGGSTDGTLDLIAEFDRELEYWVSESDEGISDAWNKGVALAAGDYVGFLNAGDTYLPNAVEHAAARIPGCDFTWGDLVWITESGAERLLAGREEYQSVIRYIMPFNHPTMFFRTDAIRCCGGFQTRYHLAMDYALIRALHRRGGTGCYVPAPIARMAAGGVHDVNYSKTVAEVEAIAVENGGGRFVAWLAAKYTLVNHSRFRDSVVVAPIRWAVRALKRALA